jgi:hypothetical protein
MSYISPVLRQFVSDRANAHCEYCLFPQVASLFIFEIEHIIAEKHGGASEANNLALACPYCNRFKGTDLGSLDPDTQQLTAFFHPRLQRWADHFCLEPSGQITPLTPEGRVTTKILKFNHPERVLERYQFYELIHRSIQ